MFIDDYSPLFITIQQVFRTKGRQSHQTMQYSFSKSSSIYDLLELWKQDLLNILSHESNMKRAPTFVIRSRYLSSIAWLSWQPANNCHTSALNASGTPLFTRVDNPFGRAPRLLCLRKQENKPFILPSPLLICCCYGKCISEFIFFF